MRTRDLTTPQKRALITAAAFLLAGEWDETITATQKRSLEQAADKLRDSIATATGKPEASR